MGPCTPIARNRAWVWFNRVPIRAGGMARRGIARACPPIAAASGGLVEGTRLDGDLAQRDLDAAQVGLHDGQQVGQGAPGPPPSRVAC